MEAMEANDAAAPDPLLGRVLAGKFQIEAFIGAGAMGSVYRARQLALDKVVAIKVLKPELATEVGFAARFKREAKAASSLDHGNSVRVLDFGAEPDNLLYMAMEYLSGQNLSGFLSDKWPLPDDLTVSIMAQALSALARAHEIGIVHRDLKPDNVMILDELNDEGHPVVKVCDFGIAKLATRSASPETRALTNLGTVLGTPEFMSPEQGRGEELDGRSDIYSLGVILFQILTREIPFDSETPLGLVYKHAMEPLRPPLELNPNANPLLDAIVQRAMEKRKEARFQTAREMRSALLSVLDPNATVQSISQYSTNGIAPAPAGVPQRLSNTGPIATARTGPNYAMAVAPTAQVYTPVGGTHTGAPASRAPMVAIAVIAASVVAAGIAFGVTRLTARPEAASKPDVPAATASAAPAAPAPAAPPVATLATGSPVPDLSAENAAAKPAQQKGGGSPAANAGVKPQKRGGGGHATAEPAEPAPPVATAPAPLPPPAPTPPPAATETGTKKPALDTADPWKQ